MGFSSILFRQAEANSFAVLETEGAEYGVDKSNGKHSIQQLEDQSRSPSPCFVKYITRRDIATKQVGGGSLVCLGRANILFLIIQRGARLSSSNHTWQSFSIVFSLVIGEPHDRTV